MLWPEYAARATPLKENHQVWATAATASIEKSTLGLQNFGCILVHAPWGGPPPAPHGLPNWTLLLQLRGACSSSTATGAPPAQRPSKISQIIQLQSHCRETPSQLPRETTSFPPLNPGLVSFSVIGPFQIEKQAHFGFSQGSRFIPCSPKQRPVLHELRTGRGRGLCPHVEQPAHSHSPPTVGGNYLCTWAPPTMTSLPELHISPHPSSILTSVDFTSPKSFALKHNTASSNISINASHNSDTYPTSRSSTDPTMRYTPASSRGNSAPNTPPLSILTSEDKDVFNLPAVEALRLMARSIEVLVSFTGDIPPTPPLSQPTSPALSAVNDKGLQTPSESPNMDASTLNAGFSFGSESSCDLDGVKVKKHSSKPTPEEEGKFIAAGVDNAIQHGAITRKFWSKSVPEIPIEDYIFRFVARVLFTWSDDWISM